MYKILATTILGSMLAAAQTPAQTQPTAAELLQKGVYAQETAGDLEGAVKIYRQIVDSHPVQQEFAAQAQYRLGMTLLQKGDAALASQEIQRLAWDFPNYKDLITASKNANVLTPAGRAEIDAKTSLSMKSGMIPYTTHVMPTGQTMYVFSTPATPQSHDSEFDFTKITTVTGKVVQLQFIDPIVWVAVNSNGNGTRVSLASPDSLTQGGWTRSTVKLGDQVTITGAPALDGSQTMQATSVSANGTVIFSRAATATK